VARARMTRQELKTQDEITTTIQKIIEFADAKKKELSIGVGAVLVVVLAIVGWSYYSSSRNAAASAQLSNAISAYNDTTIKSDKERYDKTIAEAQKTVASYGSMPAGVIAKYYIGLSQDGLGDTAGATKTLEEVIARGDSNIKPVAQFALAGIYKRHGDLPKAIETLQTLQKSGSYSKGIVTLELGKLYEANKQPDQAKVYYNQVITELTDAPFRQDAEAGLKRLGFPLPTPGTPGATPTPAPAEPGAK
jgi:predicted negative regulator of RcsB-dependent stress response